MSRSKVTAVPGLNLTGPPESWGATLQAWGSAFSNAWAERSGASGTGENQWLTKGDVDGRVSKALVGLFSNGISGSEGLSEFPDADAIKDSIRNLEDEIRKSVIYQFLEQAIPMINLDDVKADIEASFGSAYAAIGQEQFVRASKDNAMAGAINQIWAQMGGSTAVIQDGQLASVTPSAASATKWTQVTAAVTDPNTGLVNSSSIKQDLNTYANSANGTFSAIYSVRAQLDIGGRTVVGGFGLAATAGAGSAQGPLIDFGVRADRFFIAAVAATPDGVGQEALPSEIPFMVLTYAQWVNGIYYLPGTYMKRATIGDLTVGTAKIADAAITNAKIGGSISSNGFLPGTTGWYLDRGGYFEVHSIYARGDIRATTVTANTITAENIISDSLGKFYTTTSGSITITLTMQAKCVRVMANGGLFSYVPGGDTDPVYELIGVQVFLGATSVGIIRGGGVIADYDSPAGTYTLTFRRNDSGAVGALYTGRVDVEVIYR